MLFWKIGACACHSLCTYSIWVSQCISYVCVCVNVCISACVIIKVCVFRSLTICPFSHLNAPRCPLLRLAPALPPHCSSSPSTTSFSSTVLVPLPLPFLLARLHRDVAMAAVVARGSVSQSLAVLAEVSRVNQRHHVLVPWLGSSGLIGRAGQGSKEAIGWGAPDREADCDSGPVVAMLLHLAMVDTTMRQLSPANQDTPLDHHHLVTCYHLGKRESKSKRRLSIVLIFGECQWSLKQI